MIRYFAIVFLAFFAVAGIAGQSTSLYATGDAGLDSALSQLNKKISKKHQKRFVSSLSKLYQLPPDSIGDLFYTYEFSAADSFLTVAISDLTGQPLKIVSRAYIENKSKGWGFVLDQLNITSDPGKLAQLKNDLELFLNRQNK